MQGYQRNPELLRLYTLAKETHDASELASFIERSIPSISINLFGLLSVICNHLASDFVQKNPASLFVQSLLRCIGAINTHASKAQPEGRRQDFLEALPGVLKHRKDIWRCIKAVHERVVNDVNLETSARLLTSRTNLNVLNLLAVIPTIDITPGITAILVQMAHLEMMAGSAEITEEHDVIMKLNHYLPTALQTWPEIAWQKEVLEPMRGDVARIASVYLWHLEFRRSLPRTSPDWAVRVGSATGIIHNLSIHSPISEAMVAQKSHIILVEVLTSLSATPQPASAELSILVDSACMALVVQLGGVDSLERQIVAHETGILPALLRCSKFIQGDIYSIENGWYILLFMFLLPFTIYPSISRVVKREMHNFKISSLAPKVEQLHMQLRAMMDDIAVIKSAKPSCENCHKRNESEAPKLCAGCKMIYYCSRPCQTSHWKMHRERCKMAQKRSSELSNDSLSLKDYSAVPDMLQRELRMRFKQMISIRRKFAFKEPLNVEINYAAFPFQITVGSAHFLPERCHQLAAQDRKMMDRVEATASRIPGSIVARYLYPTGNLLIRLGEIIILDQHELTLNNTEGKLSETYYSVRARKDNGTYEVVHQP